MPSSASPTPQPLRESKPGNEFPYSRATELWDQLANVVFGITDVSLSVGTPVPARYQIHAQGDLDTAGGVLSIAVDTVATSPSATAPAPGTISAIAFVDVPAGLHTITITATGAIMTNPVIVVRRGRRP